MSATRESKSKKGPPERNGSEPQVLDLTDLVPTRKLVKLATVEHPEGEVFELRLVDDFGIEMQQKLLAWAKRFAQLMSKADGGDELDEDEQVRLRFVLDGVFERVLQNADGKELSAAQRKKIEDKGRHRVMQAFTWGPTVESQRVQTALIQRLVDRGNLTQEHVDEVMAELREQLMRAAASQPISGS